MCYLYFTTLFNETILQVVIAYKRYIYTQMVCLLLRKSDIKKKKKPHANLI